MTAMRKIIFIIMFIMFIMFIMIFNLGFSFLNAGELGNLNLKGLQFIITAAQFNGIVYGEGYDDPAEETIKEFNLEDAFAGLKSAGIPLDKDNIRGIYKHLETQLQKAELKILKMKKYTSEAATVIPTLTAGIDIVPVSGNANLYITVVHLTLSKWFSNWAGTTRILAPVYIWSAKKIAPTSPGELLKTIESSTDQLVGEFIQELKEANREAKGGKK